MNKSTLLGWIAGICISTLGYAAESVPAVPALIEPSEFAVVDGEGLDTGIFLRRVLTEMRQTFYHGRIPAEKVNPFRHKIANQLIDEHLLAREAVKRGVAPDSDEVAKRWAALDKRNQDNPDWADARERLRPVFEADWMRESRAKQLLAQARDVGVPTASVLQDYYQNHRELFTEPASHRISLILLGVDPGAGEAAWVEAEKRAEGLYQELQAGADFGEMAMAQSTDFTADQGGDMGVMHEGMIGEDVQKTIEKMAPGETSKPMRLLQGVALFRLVSRVEPVQHTLAEVRERAQKLWRREAAKLAEESLLFELHQAADSQINEAVVTLPGSR